jgi:ketosteroid isomerase-like protein
MSQDNVELIRRVYDAWNRGDVDSTFEVFDHDIEWVLPEGGLNSGIYRGHDAVRELLEGYLEAFDLFRQEPEQFFDAPGRVVAFIRTSVRGKGSGAEATVRPAHLWTIREGKVVRMEVFPAAEREKALEVLGLEEPKAAGGAS